jgi:hypothetical protein
MIIKIPINSTGFSYIDVEEKFYRSPSQTLDKGWYTTFYRNEVQFSKHKLKTLKDVLNLS